MINFKSLVFDKNTWNYITEWTPPISAEGVWHFWIVNSARQVME